MLRSRWNLDRTAPEKITPAARPAVQPPAPPSPGPDRDPDTRIADGAPPGVEPPPSHEGKKPGRKRTHGHYKVRSISVPQALDVRLRKFIRAQRVNFSAHVSELLDRDLTARGY